MESKYAEFSHYHVKQGEELMFIIFGTRTTEKAVGEFVSTTTCGRCNQLQNYQLYQITNWFTLFFIPIIPYRTKYYEICSFCREQKELPKALAQSANLR